MSSVPPNSRQAPAPAVRTNSTPDSTISQASFPAGGGAQELAVALEFLDGKGGRQVNKPEAADWLWKSVAKRNTEAAVLLARLYLRGEGVEKNCDQGRVLLDIAAKKGSAQAASMIENLRGFGCP